MSQNKKILSHLKSRKTLTPMQALRMFGCFRLSARIANLKEMGINVKTRIIRVGKNKRVAEYYL